MRALVTGATGTIGRRIVAELGNRATVLSRHPESAAQTLKRSQVHHWDAQSVLDPHVFDGVTTVFHLAGEPVAEGRWSLEKKERIRSSRVVSTRALVDSFVSLPHRPETLVCASAVGFYGSRGDELLDEDSSSGTGFLPLVCREWEAEAHRATELGVRVVNVRIGIVLATDGGALPRMLPIFRWGIAGKLGSGKQWMPWVHVDDVVGLFLFAAQDPRVNGPLNASAPEIVSNARFTRELASAVHRPALLAAPAFALRLAMGETADVILASQRVVPAKALGLGYRFDFPTLQQAFAQLLAPNDSRTYKTNFLESPRSRA